MTVLTVQTGIKTSDCSTNVLMMIKECIQVYIEKERLEVDRLRGGRMESLQVDKRGSKIECRAVFNERPRGPLVLSPAIPFSRVLLPSYV